MYIPKWLHSLVVKRLCSSDGCLKHQTWLASSWMVLLLAIFHSITRYTGRNPGYSKSYPKGWTRSSPPPRDLIPTRQHWRRRLYTWPIDISSHTSSQGVMEYKHDPNWRAQRYGITIKWKYDDTILRARKPETDIYTLCADLLCTSAFANPQNAGLWDTAVASIAMK